MRHQRNGWLQMFVLPSLIFAHIGYEAQPVEELHPPNFVLQGYQPPPSPMLFEPPKSHFNSYQGHLQSIRSNYDRYQEYISNTNDRFKYSQPSSNNAEMWDLHTVRPESPLLQSTVSRQLVYMMKNSSNLINTIVVHIYLSAKEKHVDTMANSGMIKGVFGIGTSHGGPGTHTNPTVITKDFDRDRWEFIDEIKAKDMIEEGPANIVEVKATVLTPNRRIEKTINKAINSELERAIPVVINRMQGSTLNMDNELRKELEQALVDEIAKNLGDTIDQMGSNLSDEDLGKLIEEGFNEIDKEFTTIQSKQNTIHLIHTTTTPTTTHVFRTTSSPTTTKRTTTIAMDEMIEESPFEKISTPYRPQRPHVSANPPSQPPHFTKSTTRGTSRSMEKTTRPVTKPAETTTRPGSYKATMASRRVINTTYATATTKIINRANWMTQKTTQRVTSTDGLSVVGSQSTAGAPSMRPPNSIKSSTTVRTYTRVTTPVTSVTYSTLPTTQKRLYETTTDMPHTTIRSTTSRAITQTPLNNKPTAKIGLLPGVYRNFTVRPLSQIITTQSSSTKQNIVDQKPSDVKEDSTRLLGSIQPTETLKEELEPKIVTSRPIHIISLDDDDDTTSTRKGIGLHVTAPSSQTSTMSLPHITAEVKEFGFSQPTITAITSTITSSSDQRSTVTSPSDFDNFSKQQNQAVTITTSDADYLNQGEIINSFPASMFPTLPEESEEELVDRNDHMVMKMRPVNFGDQNIMRANIMPEVLQTDSSKESNEMDSTSILPATNTVQQSTGTTFKILDNEETQQQKSTSMSVTKSSSTTPFQPHTITTQHTSFDEININTSNSPPFQAVPGVFEDQLSTSKQQESSTTSGRAEEMSTLNSPTGEIFPHPYTFITPKEPCPTPNDKSDRNRTDVLFLLDSSSSYNEHKFMSSLQLIQDTVSYFQNIGPDGTQVSLVQYNTEPYLEFSLRKHNCKQWLINDIADTEYMQGGNMSNKAVEKVSRFAFTKNRGDRPEAENVLVIITDGQSEDRVQEPVEIAKKNSLTVLVIATLEVDPHHLMELTGNMDNIFQFTTHPNKSLPRKLAERINSVAAEFAEMDAIRVVDDRQGMIISSIDDISQTEDVDQKEKVTNEIEDDKDTKLIEETSTTISLHSTVTSTTLHVSEAQHIVQLDCSPAGFKIGINAPPAFDGVAVVRGQENNNECRKEIHAPDDAVNYTVGFVIAKDACGINRMQSIIPAGYNYSLILHLKHYNTLVTDEDRAYILKCFIAKQPDAHNLTADLNVIKGELIIAETISLLSVPPTCFYSIRKDSPDGAVVKNAFVGQTIYHRWECDGGEEANQVYGIHIHSCYASNDITQKFLIVNDRGCSLDSTLLSHPKYDDNHLIAYAKSKTFAFENADSLKFACKLSLCTRDEDGCEGITPPKCDDNSSEHSNRQLIHHNTAIDGALSSALSTKVDVTLNGSPRFQDRILQLLTKERVPILLATLLILFIIGVVILLQYLREDINSTTTCYDPESCSPLSVTDSVQQPLSTSSNSFASIIVDTSPTPSLPSLPLVEVSENPTNQRLANFTVGFDRSRYV